MIRVSVGASAERPSSYPPNVVFSDTGEARLGKDPTNLSEWGSGEAVYIMVAVKDSRIGISSQCLNVCREICHLRGGEIGVSSTEGHGGTSGFFFRVRHADNTSVGRHNRLEATHIDTLCSDTQALGNEMSGVNESTKEPEISEDSPVMTAQGAALDAVENEREPHTCGIARDISERRRLNRIRRRGVITERSSVANVFFWLKIMSSTGGSFRAS